MEHQTIFAPKDFNQAALDRVFNDIPDRAAKLKKIENWQAAIRSGRILGMKEEQLKDEFIKTFFGEVLGYLHDLNADAWQLEIERSTEVDSKKPDGVLGFFSTSEEQVVRAVIELKGSKINLDKKQNRKDFAGTPIEQAFSYVPKMGGKCNWVIVSDFVEIRLYHASDLRRCERFHIPDLLVNGDLKKFFFLLYKDRLFWAGKMLSPIESLLENRQAALQKIEAEFYADYAAKRILLLDALRRDNPARSNDELISSTQRLLDRLIFIAFVRDMPIVKDVFENLSRCYDNSFSAHPQLAWQLLKELFNAFDRGYSKKSKIVPPFNGGLFQPDASLENLALADETVFELVDFVRRYDFKSELDVNILGHIFEQSINDLEKLKADLATGLPTPPPEPSDVNKKKKQGIFYTPEYITRFIVEQAIGGWLDERRQELLTSLGVEELTEPSAADYATITPDGGGNLLIQLNRRFWKDYQDHLRRIKVLDPACGSGAFLNQVFNYLYLEWKISEVEIAKLSTPPKVPIDRVSEGIFASGNVGYDGDSYRDAVIRRSIVSHNLYGVDLSAESVEITKLSLWLKTASKSISLADLSENIRQGNSLIDDPAVETLAFRWDEEFREIMEDGGFDVVVGNPPYVFGRDWKYEEGRAYRWFLEKYEVAEYQFDMYVLFWERAIKLLNPQGKMGFITPNTWLNNQKTTKLRKYILQNTDIASMADYSSVNVFEEAVVLPVITNLSRRKTLANEVKIFKPGKELQPAFSHGILQDAWLNDDLCVINFNLKEGDAEVLEKIERAGEHLERFADVKRGVSLYKTGMGKPKQTPIDAKKRVYEADRKIDESYRPYLEGKDIGSFTTTFRNRWVKYGSNLAEPRYPELFEGHRLLVRRIVGKRLIVVFLDNDFVADQLLQIVKPFDPNDAKYLLAVLNSSVVAFYFRKKYNRLDKTFPEIRIYELESIPIPRISPESQAPFIAQADLLLQKHSELHDCTSTFLRLLQANFPLASMPKKLEEWHRLTWKEFLEEMKKAKAPIKPMEQAEWLKLFDEQKKLTGNALALLEKADRELDRMVYELYGLTQEEIAVVEAGA